MKWYRRGKTRSTGRQTYVSQCEFVRHTSHIDSPGHTRCITLRFQPHREQTIIYLAGRVFTWKTIGVDDVGVGAAGRIVQKTSTVCGKNGVTGGRVQLKRDGTRWRTGGEVKGKLVNGVGIQYPSHYLGTLCIQHYYCWCAHLGCQHRSYDILIIQCYKTVVLYCSSRRILVF